VRLGRFGRLLVVAGAGLALVAATDLAAGQPAASAAPGSEQISHDELNKQLNSPVSTIWSLNFQSNFQFFEGHLSDQTRRQYKLTLEIDYALVKPEDYGQRWFQMIPVIPALVKDPLFN